MKPEYLNHQYFNSYYYANIVNNLIIHRWNFLGFVSRFLEAEPIVSLVRPYQKESTLHRFIYYVISTTIEEEAYDDAVEQLRIARSRRDIELGRLYIEDVFENYQIDCYSFKDFCPKAVDLIVEDDFSDYYDELILCTDIDGLYKKITEEVFYIIFNNRNLLLNFNWIVSGYIKDLDVCMFEDDFQENSIYLLKEGQLKRESIPVWAKHAVYFRDRGNCCLCKKDLSGTLSLNNEMEYDHIVPLNQGGTNDITNIQLLCKECNRNKGERKIVTSNLYEKWY